MHFSQEQEKHFILLFKWPQWIMLRVTSSWQNILDGKQENYNKMEMMIYTKSLEAEKKIK